MRIAVVGPTGQLGRDVLRAAAASGQLDAIPLERSRLDLARPEGIRPALEGVEPDVLVNCAAYTAVDAAESDARAAFDVNAYGVEALASCCASLGVRLVHVSTDYVFDGETGSSYSEDDAPGPINIYGASKLAGEALARRTHPTGCTIIRTSSVFGAGGLREGGGNFVETMIRVGRERGRLRVVDDVFMAPTYSADLASAVLALIGAGAEAGTCHWTNAGEASWHQFAEAIVMAEGVAAEVEAIPSEEYPTPARRPRRSVLDTTRATRALGPAPHWRDALERYLQERREILGSGTGVTERQR